MLQKSEGDNLEVLRQQWAATIKYQLDQEFKEERAFRLQHHKLWRGDENSQQVTIHPTKQEQEIGLSLHAPRVRNALNQVPTTFWTYGGAGSRSGGHSMPRSNSISINDFGPSIVRGKSMPCLGCWNRTRQEVQDSVRRRWCQNEQFNDPFAIYFES
ncbi:hypothetical protein FHG87_001412 [Trinorchestia longiramus]|nr:hypothetical protein FHG87_001412 [Trinorchestia longiramus]